MPRLLRTVGRTAVIAGTASAVGGRVQRRQNNRWAAQEEEKFDAFAFSSVIGAGFQKDRLVGLAAGGSADVTSRVMAKWMSEHLGQSFFAENRTGAAWWPRGAEAQRQRRARAPAAGF